MDKNDILIGETYYICNDFPFENNIGIPTYTIIDIIDILEISSNEYVYDIKMTHSFLDNINDNIIIDYNNIINYSKHKQDALYIYIEKLINDTDKNELINLFINDINAFYDFIHYLKECDMYTVKLNELLIDLFDELEHSIVLSKIKKKKLEVELSNIIKDMDNNIKLSNVIQKLYV